MESGRIENLQRTALRNATDGRWMEAVHIVTVARLDKYGTIALAFGE